MSEKDKNLAEIAGFFPYDRAREFQDELVSDIYSSIAKRQSILIHAPTGIGKTAGVLAPALKFLFDEKERGHRLKIFFLTSRHTQHSIVVETIRMINGRGGKQIILADIFGKKFLCGFDDVVNFLPSDFSEYCRSLRSEKKCHYYSSTMDASSQEKKFSKAGLAMISRMKAKSAERAELRAECKDAVLCPYEITCGIARDADVVICDYNHIFNTQIREAFFKKIGADLENSIIIIDEAHNLPERIREMLSMEISEKGLQLALRENKRFSQDCGDYLRAMIEFFISRQADDEGKTRFGEVLIENSEILDFLKARFDIPKMLEEMELAADEVRRQQKRSFLGRAADFLRLIASTQEYEEFITIGYSDASDGFFTIEYFCTDPSILTKEVIDKAKSIVLMSATLEPMDMYSDVLGFDYPNMHAYGNPFPAKNRLTLIIPETTTKYEFRNDVEYRRIAFHMMTVLSLVPGRAVVFFPSYSILNSVIEKSKLTGRQLYIERQKLSKEGKAGLIREFLKDEKGVLCAVVGASFSEGIDLPNKLKCVMLVGLPLRPPNIKARKLIQLYQERFGRGFEYGYFIPAMSKAIQSAGRCIRSSTDYGALVFLDKRYDYENYRALMPKDWNIVSTSYYEEVLSDFFKKKR